MGAGGLCLFRLNAVAKQPVVFKQPWTMPTDEKEPGQEEVRKHDIVFNVAKRETHNHKTGFKKLFKKLRFNYNCSHNKDEMASDWLDKVLWCVRSPPALR